MGYKGCFLGDEFVQRQSQLVMVGRKCQQKVIEEQEPIDELNIQFPGKD